MSGNSGGLNRLLSEELKSLGLREASLEAQRKEIVAEMEGVRRRRDLVEALLALADAEPATGGASEGTRLGDLLGGSELRRRTNGRDVADIAYGVLAARGKKPMYYEDLAEQVTAAGGVLGGQTPAQTLVARISRDPRFVRPEKRGWYALREFYPKAKSVGARRARGVAATRK